LDQFRQIYLASPAGRAGNDLRTDETQFQGPENPIGDGQLPDRITGDGNPDRVANTLVQKSADPESGFDRSAQHGPRFGNTQVKGIVHCGGKEAVGAYRRGDIRGFQGYLQAEKVQILHKPDVG